MTTPVAKSMPFAPEHALFGKVCGVNMALARSIARVAHVPRSHLRMGVRFAGQTTKPTQEQQELALLDEYTSNANALDAPLTHSTENAKAIVDALTEAVRASEAEALKKSLAASSSKVANAGKLLSASPGVPSTDHPELVMKSALLSQQMKLWANKPAPYLSSQSAVEELARAILTADGQQRLEAYLRSYGPKINEPELHRAVEDYCHATANAWSALLLEFPPLGKLLKPKNHQKFVKRFVKNYVRDTFDVNLKARCMYYWAEKTEEEKEDPNMVKAPELVKIDVDSILKVQKQYFPEVATLAQVLATDYKKQRLIFYEEKRKRKDLYLYGALFFVVINIGDFIVQLL